MTEKDKKEQTVSDEPVIDKKQIIKILIEALGLDVLILTRGEDQEKIKTSGSREE